MSSDRGLARLLHLAGRWLVSLQNGHAERYFGLAIGGMGALLIYALIIHTH